MKSVRRRAALLFGAVVSVNASYTVLIPFVPDLQDRAGAGPTVIALAFALFAAAKAIFQPVGGMWVDRWRPANVGCVSLFIAAFGIIITALARDPVMILAGRICWGVGEGLVTPALYAGMSALCRHYGLSTSRMVGNFGTAAVAGFLLGPLLAGIAAPVGMEVLFLVCAGVTMVTAVGILRAVPDAGQPLADDPETRTDTSTTAGVLTSWWWFGVLLFGALDMLTNLSYSALEPVLPLYLSADQEGTARGAISLVFAIGLAAFGLASWLLGRFADRLRLLVLVRLGLVFSAVGLAGLAVSANVLSVSAWFILIMLGQAVLYLAARRGIVELQSAMTRQGKAFGLFGLASDVGNVIGPIIGVALYGLTGRLSFVLLGALSGLLFVTLTVAVIWRRPRQVDDSGDSPNSADGLPAPPDSADSFPASPGCSVQTITLFDEANPLVLTSGQLLAPVTVAYETYGSLNDDWSNAIFICHALTGDSHPAAHHPDDRPGWWRRMVGSGCPVDTDRYFVICANVLGGCAGSTGPSSSRPDGTRWGPDFPEIEIADIVAVHRALLAELRINRLHAVMGGSLGGMLTLEWLLCAPDDAANFLIIAGTARHSAENLAWNSVARAAIRSDRRFQDGRYSADAAPNSGLGVARMVGHLTYLSEDLLEQKFGRTPRVTNGHSPSVVTGPFSVESYLEHQADSLTGRFDANSYLYLISAMDSFDAFAEGRELHRFQLRPNVYLFSFESDRLYGPHHSRHIQAGLAALGFPAEHYRDSTSMFGHDAFLLDVAPFLRQVAEILGRDAAVRNVGDSA